MHVNTFNKIDTFQIPFVDVSLKKKKFDTRMLRWQSEVCNKITKGSTCFSNSGFCFFVHFTVGGNNGAKRVLKTFLNIISGSNSLGWLKISWWTTTAFYADGQTEGIRCTRVSLHILKCVGLHVHNCLQRAGHECLSSCFVALLVQ